MTLRGTRRWDRHPHSGKRRERRPPLLVELLEERALPSFLPPVLYDLTMAPKAVATGDFNSDGVLDLVTANGPSIADGFVNVLLGAKDGSFGPAQSYRAGRSPNDVAVMDLDNDGALDLAVANDRTADGRVSVLWGNGDGSFNAPDRVNTRPSTTSVALGDFNRDGIGDVAAGIYSFPMPNPPGPGLVLVFLGNGDRTFRPLPPIPVDTGVLSLAAGFLNDDLHEDLVTANLANSTVSVLLGNGDGSFRHLLIRTVGRLPIDVTVADLNRDGCQDLAVANRSDDGTVSAVLGACNGTFQLASTNPVGDRSQGVAAADFDGDTIPDLVSANYRSNTVSVLSGNGDGSFRKALTFSSGGLSPTAVTAVDANRDGHMDLVVTNEGCHTVGVLLNDGRWSSPRGGPGNRTAPDRMGVCVPTGSLLEALTTCRNWIVFGPPRPYNPERDIFPTEDELRASLQQLWDEGWRGIVTYSLDGTLRAVPRIAKEVGFTYVIGGIFWFNDAQLARELKAAHEEVDSIDGYVLGNEGLLFNRYSRCRLEHELAKLRAVTKRPVTTAETGGQYLEDPSLLTLGDWVFPNTHPWYAPIRDIPQAAAFTHNQAQALTALMNPDRSLIFHETWWPTGGGDPAATPANQTAYFRRLAETPVYFVWGEGFDQFWKTGEGPHGPYWGMHTDKGAPKEIICDLRDVYTGPYGRGGGGMPHGSGASSPPLDAVERLLFRPDKWLVPSPSPLHGRLSPSPMDSMGVPTATRAPDPPRPPSAPLDRDAATGPDATWSLEEVFALSTPVGAAHGARLRAE